MKPGKNIYMIPFEAKDWDHLYRWYYSGEYEEFFRDIPQAPTSEYFQGYANLRDGFCFIVKEAMSFKTVGLVLVYDVKHVTAQACFGMLIDKEHQKTLFGLETIYLTMKHLFEDLDLRKMVIEIVETNPDFKRYMEMYEVPCEGVLLDEAKIDGKYLNVLRYAILREKGKKIIQEIGDFYATESSNSGNRRGSDSSSERRDWRGDSKKAS